MSLLLEPLVACHTEKRFQFQVSVVRCKNELTHTSILTATFNISNNITHFKYRTNLILSQI